MSQSNLLVLMSDEHTSRALGCAGHPFVKTPNLDKLAARGMRFTKAYTPSPICVPARASFATGKYVHQTRMWDNAMPYDGSIPGWGHALQKKGVPVESIGKLHYRSTEDYAGFDTEHLPMMVADGVGMVWASVRAENERKQTKNRMLGKHVGAGESTYTKYDAAVVARTKSWLNDAPVGPWCLYVGLVAPHFPLVVPQEFLDLYPLETLPDFKLDPRNGYMRHPWVEKQNAFMNSDASFTDDKERRTAMAAYYGLCSWLDHNVGQILDGLDAAGVSETTTVIYTSDHGDNVGARGLWGKSNMYEESAAVPLIMAGPSVEPGTCDTCVSLLDVSATIADHFGVELEAAQGIKPLSEIVQCPDPERPVFSEYHAAGSVSAAFMLRKGNWKYIHYVGFEDELFHLGKDPEETFNLADQPGFEGKLADMKAALLEICDPVAVNKQAFADQAALIERHGGRDAAFNLAARGATPPPSA